jgi:hypothetical protein
MDAAFMAAASRDPRDYLAADHPGLPPCPWHYLSTHCVLVRAHPSPHWLEFE